MRRLGPGGMLSLALVLLGLASAATGAELQRFKFPFEGQTRSFRLYVPDSLARFSGPRPLIVALHGIASSDMRLIDKTRGRFMELAEEYGLVVVYPRGLRRSWDLGRGDLAALNRPRRDDLAYVEHVISLVAGMAPVDPDRIFAVGHSLGGQMALSLACTRPGLVRGIAMVAMLVPDFLLQPCQSAPAFAAVIVHGTDDPVVPVDGGQWHLGARRLDRFLSFEQSLEFFLTRNGCRRLPSLERLLDADPDDRTRVLIRRWQACSATPVAAYLVYGGGHQWPREPQALPTVLGRASQEIDPASEIWRFFSQL